MTFIVTCRAEQEELLRTLIFSNRKMPEHSMKLRKEQRMEKTLVCIFSCEDEKAFNEIVKDVESLPESSVITFRE